MDSITGNVTIPTPQGNLTLSTGDYNKAKWITRAIWFFIGYIICKIL